MAYRIIQELLNNIQKHAKAQKAFVKIIFSAENIHVSVKDNGIGFNTQNVSDGIGIKNIKARIKFLDAKYKLSSSSNGTSFSMDIPVKKTEQN
jgi:two-component system sensor histidine kinase DegS